MDERQECHICDGPYCGPACQGRPGYVWVNGRGWKSPEQAQILQTQLGRTVQWDDVFTWERYGVTDPDAL